MIKRPLVLWLLMSVAVIFAIFIKAKTGGFIMTVVFLLGGLILLKSSGKSYVYKGHRLKININKYDRGFFIIGIILVLVMGIKTYQLLYDHSHNHDEDNNQTIKISGIIKDKKIREQSLEYIVATDAGEIVQVCEYFDENTVKNYEDVFSLGTNIVVHGKKKNYESATNPGQFDEYNYYRLIKGYCYKINAASIKKMQGDDKTLRFDYKVREELFEVKAKLLNQASKVFNEKDSGLVKAMVLGEKSAADEELKELYTDSGIIHLMVISGTHISLLSMFVYSMLNKLLKVRWAGIISFFVTLVFVALTGFTISSNRAVIMLLLFLLAKIIMRSYDMKSAIGLSGLIILWVNPLSVLSSGFILSFLAVIAIAYPFEKCVEIMNKDFQERNKKREGTLWGEYDFFVENVKKSMVLSGVINIMTLPVVLYTYFKYPLYSIVVNVIVAPFMSYVIIITILAIFLSYIWLPLGQFMAGSVHFILLLYEKVCQMVSKLPFNEIRTGRPEWWQIVVYYLLVIVLSAVIKVVISTIKPIYTKSGVLVIMISSFILLGCFMLHSTECNNGFVRMLDVGQGDCFYINGGNGIKCLMDGGSTSNMNVGNQIIEKYLMSINVWELDYVFISHFDGDHIGGIVQLIENGKIKINNIVVPYMGEDRIDDYHDYMQIIRECEAEIYYAKEGLIVDEGDLKLLCLNPDMEIDYSSSNALSACYYMENEEVSYLFTGDVCDEGEENLINNLVKYRINKVDFLKVAHHGSKSSTSKELLALIKPKIALISCGKDNSYGHPHEEVVSMLKEAGCKIVITAESGSCRLDS